MLEFKAVVSFKKANDCSHLKKTFNLYCLLQFYAFENIFEEEGKNTWFIS